ncbi:hypothetical protein KY289_032025 [Solanum tuberosum]|nr:hypothetical protein KY289_032025 [Solanum tuberosum]
MEGRTFFSAGEKSFELIDISEDRVRWFMLCERRRRFVRKIRIDENNLRWVCGTMKEASKGEGKLCRRWGRKIEAYIFRVYQNFNSYGRFVRVEAWLGDKKSSVIIPEIIDNGGWEDIANKILRFLWRPPMQSDRWNPNSQARSFCEVSKMEKWPTIESSRPNQAIPTTTSDNCNFLDKCLVGRFNDSFHNNPHYDTIQKWFYKRWKMTAGLKVSPISHNLFLFEMPSRQEAARVKAGDWFWNGRRLSLDWWSPLVNLDTKVLPSGDRWIKAFGIPLHAWLKSSFQKIGELCGGYVDIDEDTKKKSNLLWARICIKDKNRNLPCKLELKVADLSYEIWVIPDAHTKIWAASEEADRKGKRKVGEEAVGFSRKAEVNTVVRPLAQHVPFIVDSNLPANQIVGPNPNYNGIRKRADFNSKVEPSGYKGKAFFKRGPNLDKRNKRKNTWTPRAQDPCIFNPQCSPARKFLDPITFELKALERQRVVFDNEVFDCHSNCEADDEGDKGSTYSFSLHGFQDQQPEALEIPKKITSLIDAATDSDQSSISRNNDHLLLPWHGEGIPGQQVIHTPSVISTSKWTKLVMVKACKAFGVNAIGFEHELLGMILRMDQRRQDQAKQGFHHQKVIRR